MKIIVCIKQVPASSDVKIDPITGTLIRDGNNTKMNPYDLYAIETALRIKEQSGASVCALTMGPPPATSVLEEAVWMGCDDGVLMTDRKFGGADVVATSYTLSQGINKVGYDLIICGKQTTDGDTAQVGAEIAEHLGIPYACYVDSIIEVKEKSIIVRSNMDNTFETKEIAFPCLITIDKGSVTPRLPSFKRSVQYKNHEYTHITMMDLADLDENHYGLKGSPTQVEKMFNPDRNTDKVVLNGTSEDLANKITDILTASKFI